MVERRADWFALVADEFGLTFEGVDPAALDRLWGVVLGAHEAHLAHQSAARGQRYGGPVTPDEFRKHGYQLIDWIVDYLEQIEQHPVASPVQPGEVRAMLPEHPPTEPESFDAVLADLDRIVVPGLTHWQHPSFFAYFPGNSGYPSILGDLAAAGLGVQGMSWVTSPACTEVETLMLDWMQELLGLPDAFRSTSDNGGGVIHGSASEATLASILAARWRITGGEVNIDGDTSKLVAYATSQAHSSIEKGLRIAGIGTAQTADRRPRRRVRHGARRRWPSRSPPTVPPASCRSGCAPPAARRARWPSIPSRRSARSPGGRACGCTSTRR